MCGKKVQIYGVNIPRKFIDSRHFYSCLSSSSCHHSPRKHSFKNLFPPTAERSEGDYDLLHQKSVRKYEDDLEH